METIQIINWLEDKAVRADSLSWTRMMQKAAQRLRELDAQVKTATINDVTEEKYHEC